MTAKIVFLVVMVTASFVVATDQNEDDDGDVMKMLQAMEKEIAVLKAENKVLREDLKTVAHKKDLMQEIQKIQDEKQMTADTMFLATISEFNISIADGEHIVWDHSPINPGGHFDTILGAYTAPANGYYQFSVSKHGNNYEGSFYLLVDEDRHMYKEAHFPDSNDTPSGSATINIELMAGQVVRVENQESTTVFGSDSTGYMYSWFTGYLLYGL